MARRFPPRRFFFMSFCLTMEGWCDNIILVKSLFCWFYQCVSICLVSRYRFYILIKVVFIPIWGCEGNFFIY